MAEESVELPVTSEETKSSRVEVRRYSAGKASSGNSGEKIVPHHLRASTGSCHDFCKYGREHAFEAKERRSIPSRATRKKLHQSSEEGIGGIMMSGSRLSASVDSRPTKTLVVKLTKSVDSKLQISDTFDSNKQEPPTKSSDNKKQTRNEGLVKRNKASLLKVKPSLLKSHTSPSASQEISPTFKEVESPSESTSKKVGTPSKSTSKKVGTPSKSNSKKVETPSKSTFEKVKTPSKSSSQNVGTPSTSTSSIKTSPTPTSKVKTSLKSTSKMMETSSESSALKGIGTKLSEKYVTSLKPISVPRKTISSMNSSEGFGGQRNKEIKMENGAAASKAASRKLMAAPLRASLSPRLVLKRVPSINSRKHKGLKIASHLVNQQTANAKEVDPEERNAEVEEKTLYVIKMESENKTLQSHHSARCNDESSLPQMSPTNFPSSSNSQSLSQEDQEESEYTTSEFEEDSVSGNHEIEHLENGEILDVVEKAKPRKGGIVYSEDKNCQMSKLKFRRGRMIENKIENHSPRRLKFRRAKVSEKAYVKAEAQRKSFKRRDEACADSSGATTSPEKVVLRHQDMQDKKDAQGLFNNVIEETASKLAETRKSKVKALVGAFETVISLQEKKP